MLPLCTQRRTRLSLQRSLYLMGRTGMRPRSRRQSPRRSARPGTARMWWRRSRFGSARFRTGCSRPQMARRSCCSARAHRPRRPRRPRPPTSPDRRANKLPPMSRPLRCSQWRPRKARSCQESARPLQRRRCHWRRACKRGSPEQRPSCLQRRPRTWPRTWRPPLRWQSPQGTARKRWRGRKRCRCPLRTKCKSPRPARKSCPDRSPCTRCCFARARPRRRCPRGNHCTRARQTRR
jgi:hypothetical protein